MPPREGEDVKGAECKVPGRDCVLMPPSSVPKTESTRPRQTSAVSCCWLQHLYEVDQDPVLSQPVTVNLRVTCPSHVL